MSERHPGSMEGNHKDSDKKLHALLESSSVKPISGFADVARFGEAALEVAKNFSKTAR